MDGWVVSRRTRKPLDRVYVYVIFSVTRVGTDIDNNNANEMLRRNVTDPNNTMGAEQ